MAWTLDQARSDLGIEAGDTSKDGAIERGMSVVLALAETYCARKFLAAREVYRSYEPGRVVIVPRYPISDVFSVTNSWGQVALDAAYFTVDSQSGRVGFLRERFPVCTTWGWIDVDYSGGYLPDGLPADLEAALWEIFHGRWALTGGTGSPKDAADRATGTGLIKTLTIPNVISTTMDNGASSGSASSAYALAGLVEGQRPILDLFRRIVL